MTNSFVIKILLGLSAVVIIFSLSYKPFKEEKKTSVEIEKNAILEDIDTTTNKLSLNISYDIPYDLFKKKD